jgi:hypothetical protein
MMLMVNLPVAKDAKDKRDNNSAGIVVSFVLGVLGGSLG